MAAEIGGDRCAFAVIRERCFLFALTNQEIDDAAWRQSWAAYLASSQQGRTQGRGHSIVSSVPNGTPPKAD